MALTRCAEINGIGQARTLMAIDHLKLLIDLCIIFISVLASSSSSGKVGYLSYNIYIHTYMG